MCRLKLLKAKTQSTQIALVTGPGGSRRRPTEAPRLSFFRSFFHLSFLSF